MHKIVVKKIIGYNRMEYLRRNFEAVNLDMTFFGCLDKETEKHYETCTLFLWSNCGSRLCRNIVCQNRTITEHF